jgi:hypothetical protein
MPNEERTAPLGRPGEPEYDELQRGEEKTLTVETMGRLSLPHYGERREIPVPDPGERPGAIRVETGGQEDEAAADEE